MALEGAYNFDTDGTDYSGNGRTLTLGANGVSVSGGHTNNGFGKTGATMPVFPGSLLTATQTDDRCVMFWAKGNLTTWWIRWEKDAIGSGTWGVLNISGSMAVQARRASDDSLLTRPTGTQPSTTWHHYCATYTRSTGVCRLLVDGVQTGTQSFAAGTQLTVNADRINMAEWSTTGAAIDDLRFFSHVPTDPEIATFRDTPVTSGDTTLTDSSGAVRVGKAADTLANGVALADPVGAIRAARLSETAAVGVAIAEAAGNVRVASGAESALIGWSLPDLASSVRSHGTSETLTVGVALPDQVRDVRAAALAGDSAATGVTGTDLSSSARVSATGETVAIGVAVPDTAGTIRVAGLPETATAGVVLTDSQPASTRLSGQLADVAINSLLLPDASASSVRVGATSEAVVSAVVLADTTGTVEVRDTTDTSTVGVALADQPSAVRFVSLTETVTNSTVLADQAASVRIGSTSEQTTAGIVLLDVITAVSVRPLTETAAASVVLVDTVASVAVRGLTELVQQPLQDAASSARVTVPAMGLVGAIPATQRDLLLYVRAVDPRWRTTAIPLSRWSVESQRPRWTAT